MPLSQSSAAAEKDKSCAAIGEHAEEKEDKSCAAIGEHAEEKEDKSCAAIGEHAEEKEDKSRAAIGEHTEEKDSHPLTEDFFRKNKILIYGLGRTGLSVVHFLLNRQDQVYVYIDPLPTEKVAMEKAKAALSSSFPQCESRIHLLKEVKAEELESFNLLIKSPGIHLDRPLLNLAAQVHVPVISDIELAYLYMGPDMIAVTGSNGKTTTTSLIAHILNACGIPALACGNIGLPILDAIDQTLTGEKDSAAFPLLQKKLVVECSSYQLASSPSFAPKIALLLNLSPDHLEYHGSYVRYIASKFNIASQQTEEDFFFVNKKDQDTKSYLADHPLASKIIALDAHDATGQHIRALKGFPLIGEFNVENARFAYAVADIFHLDLEAVDRAMLTFKPVPHRMEFVRKVRGVDYINDSKGTNVDATVKALGALEGPVLLIAGGYDKHVPFYDLFPAFARQGKYLILMGETRDQIAKEAEDYGLAEKVIRVENLKEAVQLAGQKAEAGDKVLLSPASASWDMYNNFEERGDEFKEEVRKL